jgi:dihydrofolate reductase
MMLSLIVAVSENGVIGLAGNLPWHLSSDLGRFKRLTMGHTMIMGRRTFDSIGRLLPGRRTIVVTRQTEWAFPGALVAHRLEDALEAAAESGESEAFVVGGADVYAQALPRVERIYRTRVHASVPGDVYFPPLPEAGWQVIESRPQAAGDRDDYASTFEILQRVTVAQ